MVNGASGLDHGGASSVCQENQSWLPEILSKAELAKLEKAAGWSAGVLSSALKIKTLRPMLARWWKV
jgi:hypothetical protein